MLKGSIIISLDTFQKFILNLFLIQAWKFFSVENCFSFNKNFQKSTPLKFLAQPPYISRSPLSVENHKLTGILSLPSKKFQCGSLPNCNSLIEHPALKFSECNAKKFQCGRQPSQWSDRPRLGIWAGRPLSLLLSLAHFNLLHPLVKKLLLSLKLPHSLTLA